MDNPGNSPALRRPCVSVAFKDCNGRSVGVLLPKKKYVKTKVRYAATGKCTENDSKRSHFQVSLVTRKRCYCFEKGRRMDFPAISSDYKTASVSTVYCKFVMVVFFLVRNRSQLPLLSRKCKMYTFLYPLFSWNCTVIKS